MRYCRDQVYSQSWSCWVILDANLIIFNRTKTAVYNTEASLAFSFVPFPGLLSGTVQIIQNHAILYALIYHFQIGFGFLDKEKSFFCLTFYMYKRIKQAVGVPFRPCIMDSISQKQCPRLNKEWWGDRLIQRKKTVLEKTDIPSTGHWIDF